MEDDVGFFFTRNPIDRATARPEGAAKLGDAANLLGKILDADEIAE